MLGEFRDPSQDGDWSKVEAQQPKFFVYPMIFRQLGSPLLAALLAVAWPAANFLSYNFGLIRTGGGSFASIGTFTVVVAVFIVAIAAICVRLDRTMQAKRLLVAVAVLFPMLFVFQPASRPLSSLLLAWTSQARLLAAVLFLLAWCATGYAAWRLASKRRAVALFTIFLVVACAMPVASVAYQSLSVPSGGIDVVKLGENLVPSAAKGQHNIFYIIFDSYPGLEVTDDYFHIDNRDIAAFLDKEGFFNAGNFQSNYFATFLSFTAILNARYTVTAKSAAPLDMNDFYPNILQRPDRLQAVEAFQRLGYRPYFIGNWYGRCKPGVFVCLKKQAYWLDESFSSFLANTPWPSVISRFGHAAFDGDWNAVDPLLQSLPKLMQTPGLKFVLAHNIPPHPPAIYEPDCSPISGADVTGLEWQHGKARYEKNMACVNRKIKKLVDAIVSRDPDAIVVIQSDHGSFTSLAGRFVPAKISATTRFEISRPINFVRAPEVCRQWLYKGMTQVNTMRFVLACAHGARPRYLPDISYTDTSASADIHGPFVEQSIPQYPPSGHAHVHGGAK